MYELHAYIHGYVCVYVYIYAHIHISISIRGHLCTGTCVNIRLNIHVHGTCTHTYYCTDANTSVELWVTKRELSVTALYDWALYA